MIKVLLKGPVFTSSGYGVHSRQVFSALRLRKSIDLYIQPTSWGSTSWILNLDFNNFIIRDLLNYSKKCKKGVCFDETYQVTIPNEWQKISNKDIGITAGFETDIVKKEWVNKCNEMYKIIVPSEFAKSAFLKTSKNLNIPINKNITVINEWFYEDFISDNLKKDCFKDLPHQKNILIIGQITSKNESADRKNLIKTVNCALDFVKDKKEIGIVLKTNIGRSSVAYKNNLINIVQENTREKDLKKITFLFGNFSIEEMKSLYSSKKISCMLSGTRAEGYGLPFLESAACGLPIIATDYSAYKEFLNEKFIGIDFDLVVFDSDLNFVDEGSKPVWAEFRRKSMKEKLELFFSNEKYYFNKAKDLKNNIKQYYNKDIILKKYSKFFNAA